MAASRQAARNTVRSDATTVAPTGVEKAKEMVSPDAIKPSAMVSVYSISGVLLGSMPYASFVNNEAYVGMYIVKYGAKTFKIAKGGV